MAIGKLAHRVMVMAAKHHIQAGQALPTAAFDLFLEENPEEIGEALMELYMVELLEEVPHEVDRLTQKGFEYCLGITPTTGALLA
jgi:hypothetical protein